MTAPALSRGAYSTRHGAGEAEWKDAMEVCRHEWNINRTWRRCQDDDDQSAFRDIFK